MLQRPLVQIRVVFELETLPINVLDKLRDIGLLDSIFRRLPDFVALAHSSLYNKVLTFSV
jgi:hypothetical protein